MSSDNNEVQASKPSLLLGLILTTLILLAVVPPILLIFLIVLNMLGVAEVHGLIFNHMTEALIWIWLGYILLMPFAIGAGVVSFEGFTVQEFRSLPFKKKVKDVLIRLLLFLGILTMIVTCNALTSGSHVYS